MFKAIGSPIDPQLVPRPPHPPPSYEAINDDSRAIVDVENQSDNPHPPPYALSDKSKLALVAFSILATQAMFCMVISFHFVLMPEVWTMAFFRDKEGSIHLTRSFGMIVLFMATFQLVLMLQCHRLAALYTAALHVFFVVVNVDWPGYEAVLFAEYVTIVVAACATFA